MDDANTGMIEAILDSEGYDPSFKSDLIRACKGIRVRGRNRIGRKYLYINEKQQNVVWERLPLLGWKDVRAQVNNKAFEYFRDRGLPIVQKWYWPRGARSFFSYRADMDEGNASIMKGFLKAARSWSDCLSFFVCGKAYAKNVEILESLAKLGSEIGNHTYMHYVFSDYERNWLNIEHTEALLGRVGVVPKGYVGPAYFWHPSMYEVLEDKGYRYASSFGVAQDDYPFYPPKRGGGKHGLLEIPFHCIGDRFPVFDIGLEEDEVSRFFDRLMENKYALCEPMFLYGHPDMPGRIGEHPELVERIIRKARSFGDVCVGNMTDVAGWWKRRDKACADIIYDRQGERMHAERYIGTEDVSWSIQTKKGVKYIVAAEDLKKGIQLERLVQYRNIQIADAPFPGVGEVVDTGTGDDGWVQKGKLLHRNWRRKRRMVRGLREARKGMTAK